jgi:hypothetical protein
MAKTSFIVGEGASMLTSQEKTKDLRVRRTHMLLRKAFM